MTQSIEQSQFPIGTPVCVKQRVGLRRGPASPAEPGSTAAEIVGVVESWDEQSTGSWYAHAPAGKLPLKRLRIKKADGEEVLLVIDDSTQIAKLEGKQ